ncbi:hypothetical protein OCU04_011681 [Sclerotinia nivalis]|uniref:Uncharacterized protein n=1 Tax=Sclerotinia nivalis TaxID=352851 RepID=A0A9X0AC77_9HELO|nr:hypothetical protein OCU04_011681 [Sclerotinia nivalis]
MARTAAGEGLFRSAMRLETSEVQEVIARLIDYRGLDVEEIQERVEVIGEERRKKLEEKRTTMNRIMAAMRIIPRYKLRELVTDILQINDQNQKWLVNAWENKFDELDTEYEGDPNEGDPHALVVFMDEKSPITLRVLISDMAGSSESIRKYFKEKLLIEEEDGTLEVRHFEPLEPEHSPVLRSFEPKASPNLEAGVRDSSGDWDIINN